MRSLFGALGRAGGQTHLAKVQPWHVGRTGARKGRSGGEVRQEALGASQHGEGWITDVEGRKVTRFVTIGTAFYPHPKRQDFPPPTT